jgi:phosphoenolpyruvate carboxykinase (ATP)
LGDYITDAHGPQIYQICIPEWPENERQVLSFPEEGLNVVLGSDYVGEVKMGFLRMVMWKAKEEGMLSLHAGSKVITARQKDGALKRYGVLLFGLSGTGKSTHSCHDHGLGGDGEGIDILQDDVVFLCKDGSAMGAERGFYMKTEGVNSTTQPVIHSALSSSAALLENVMVTHDGRVDFTDLSLGGNGRAVVPRAAMGYHAGSGINLPPLSELDGMIIAFITRRMTVLPPVSKLTPAQAAAAFMLGESVETTAGDPRRAGESVRVVGTNPFIVGDQAVEGNWFYEFATRNADKVHCYLLNTGGVGEVLERDAEGRATVKQNVLRVDIDDMAAIIRAVARGTIEWEPEPYFGTLVPRSVEGLDMDKFGLSHFYTPDQIQGYATGLKKERLAWLKGFSGLKKEVVSAYTPD